MPLSLAEPWDNVGLLCGAPTDAIGQVLLTNDWDERVANEASSLGLGASTLVLAYHPPWFQACKRLLPGAPLTQLVRSGAALYALHTALDAHALGANAQLAEALALGDIAPLVPAADAPGAGQGRIGTVTQGLSFLAWLERLKAVLPGEGPSLAVAGMAPKLLDEAPARRVALVAGAGRALVPAALALGADVLVTGEMTHHDVLAARRQGLRIVATRHSVVERWALAALGRRLAGQFPTISLFFSQNDAEPYVFV